MFVCVYVIDMIFYTIFSGRIRVILYEYKQYHNSRSNVKCNMFYVYFVFLWSYVDNKVFGMLEKKFSE